MAVSGDEFRQALGRWASGVTVVTSGSAPEYHGMTASSFTSLSLDPPLILICVGNQTHMRSILKATGAFTVNILAADQAELSNYFASSKRPKGAEEFATTPFTVGATGAPRLDGAAGHLDCTVHQVVEAGDHQIYVGRVEAAQVPDSAAPLLYFQGQYGTFGAS